jgi:hypothetical protein
MEKVRNMKTTFLALLIGLFVLSHSPTEAHAHEAPIRIVIAGEDSDPSSIPRSSEVYSRVIAEMQDILIRDQITVIDEDMLASRAALTIDDRTDKKVVLEALTTANETTDPLVHSRLALVFSIVPNIQDMDVTRKLTVRVRGQFFDLKTLRALSSFEVATPEAVTLPKKETMCNSTCVMEKAGDVAKGLATEVAVVVTQKLHILIQDSEYAGELQGTSTAGVTAGDGTLMNVYTLRFRLLNPDDVKGIVDTLETDWVKQVELVKSSVTERILRWSWLAGQVGSRVKV